MRHSSVGNEVLDHIPATIYAAKVAPDQNRARPHGPALQRYFVSVISRMLYSPEMSRIPG